MSIIKKENKNGVVEYYMDGGVNVTIWPKLEVWEYCVEGDGETHCSGIYITEEGAVIDYDGVFELPEEVVEALKDYGFRIELL